MNDTVEPQPVKAHLAARRITVTGLAHRVGTVSRHHLGRVVNGYVEPSASLRANVAEALGMPAGELFRPPRPRSPRFPGDQGLEMSSSRPKSAR